MGYWKARQMEEEQRGWVSSDKSVCVQCVEDSALQSIVQADIDSESVCDFCRGSPAAPLDALVGAFVDGLKNEFEPAIESAPWDGREGGYIVTPQWHTHELAGEHEDVLGSEELVSAVCDCLDDDIWVRKDWVTRDPDEVLVDTWSTFCEAVKHKTRYVIWLLPDVEDIGAGEIQLSRILDHIARLLKELDLFKDLAAGRRFWRAQRHREAKIDRTAARLGTARPHQARQDNRMSPAGIPLFYGALSEETAVKEVNADDCSYTTWAAFETITEMRIVDFTSLPEVPSMFDPDRGHLRREIEFLCKFVDELSKPIDAETAQIEYVPTQIVTEFLLHVFEHDEESRTSGLIYRSSIADGDCVAFNIPNERCFDAYEDADHSEPGLLLIKDSIGTTRGSAC